MKMKILGPGLSASRFFANQDQGVEDLSALAEFVILGIKSEQFILLRVERNTGGPCAQVLYMKPHKTLIKAL